MAVAGALVVMAAVEIYKIGLRRKARADNR
jgi:hypothetical protein